MSAAQIEALQRSSTLYRTFEGEENDPAVKAWNGRTGALAAIEMRCGGFYSAATTAPEANKAFDTYEEAFRFVRAETLQGILAKLWVALSHFGPSPTDLCERADHDAVRRGDTDEVAAFIGNWDFGEEVLFGAILDLEHALKFERVYAKGDSLVPQVSK